MLLFTSLCVWWNFSDAEFPRYAAASAASPLFVLCYSRFCPHCVGLPEQLRECSARIGPRADVVLAMVDCSASAGCARFGVRGTPHVRAVVGPRQRYWRAPRGNSADDWMELINWTLSPALREVSSAAAVRAELCAPRGGAVFVLEAPQRDCALAKALRAASKFYKIYDAAFVLRVDSALPRARLRVCRSAHCCREFSGSAAQLRAFVEANKFGALHRYDAAEAAALRGRRALFYSRGPPTDAQNESLLRLAERCDAGFTLGWVDAEAEPSVLRGVPGGMAELPFMFASGMRRVHRGRIADFWEYAEGEEEGEGEGAFKLALFVASAAFIGYNVIVNGRNAVSMDNERREKFTANRCCSCFNWFRSSDEWEERSSYG